ncbi:MAG: M4 family metallopeptidase [Vicinamibacteria bacterium]|nr:M4 family metallopeptidase [Vicinamibacteria bacterium]
MTNGLRASFGLAVFGMGMMQGPATDPRPRLSAVAATSRAAISEWDQKIGALTGRGELRTRSRVDDTMLAGRTHTRFEQLYKGVPVLGGEIVRQDDAAGTLTVFGNLYEGIDLETRPALSEAAARRALEASHPGARIFPDEVDLMILPITEGESVTYALAWRGQVLTGFDVRVVFVDAQTGAIRLDYTDRDKQSAVGKGTGVLGDAKKISVSNASGTYQAKDPLRPPSLSTLDMKGDPLRIERLLVAGFPNNIPTSDYAADADNDWTDGGVVDAHVYTGYTYDYYFKRFGRKGLNNNDTPITSFTNLVKVDDLTKNLGIYGNDILDYYINAFYSHPGVMVYGVGLPSNFTAGGQRYKNFAGAIDIVGHELTHGVTRFTSNLIYLNESGALNEAFSDMMGTGVEFFFQPAGNGTMQADYLNGEDIVTGTTAFPLNGIRSMQSPTLFGDPDHYSIRYTGTQDNGGVHINSGIANNAFYLAIEGGTHRLGARVTGVGAANREQIERVFYRAFTSFLVASSNFAAARIATIQAARELYPANPAVEAAVTQAWTAVGVN